MKKLAIVTALALVVSYAATPAALANTTSVVNSGANADVTTTEVENVNVNVVNNNTAVVNQTLNSVNNTGNNTSHGNIGMTPCDVCGISGGSSIVTGDASTSNAMDVQANSNVTAVDVATNGGAQNNTDVVNTAGNLDVDTTAISNTTANVVNNNTAAINQAANVVNNTGGNNSHHNIGASSIVTGDAATVNAMSADVNENATAISITGGDLHSPIGCDLCGPCYGSNCTSIVNSGRRADVDTTSVTNTAVNVLNNNSLYTMQALNAVNNSGNNRAGHNVYGADIVTGGAGTVNDMAAGGNSNATAIALDDSMPMGVNDFLAVNSGARADFDATALVNTNVNTLNNNGLMAYETVMSRSVSGNNYAHRNIGSGLTWTGGAGTASNTVVGGNANATSVGNSAANLLTMIALMSL